MTNRMTKWQKASALIPLALLSGAWTASLAVSSATATAEEEPAGKLPDGSTIPSEAIDDPASISAPGQIAPGVPAGNADKVLSSASTNGIPAAALAAYQRAAQVIDSADAKCNIEWPLIAAIGRVESNHGTYGGNRLTSEGVSTPGIIGIALDGSNGTAKILDTDAGQYDGDKKFDRAVGPMQFIPSTWSVVGVDGDGDGERNPQDIDDAALATAVYLCSGDENLATREGQESAVYRYNHSDEYVKLVLSIMEAYAAGDYTATPNESTGGTTFSPAFGDSVYRGNGKGGGVRGYKGPREPKQAAPARSSGSAPAPAAPSGSTGGTVEAPSTSGGGGGGAVTGTVEKSTETVKKTTETVKKTTTNTLSPLQKAQNYCSDQGLGQACIDAYLKGGPSAVDSLLSSGSGGGGGTVSLP
jgi:membrane-bound lytic murein transglycosylase B